MLGPGYNFGGNHTTTSDAKVSIPTSWVRGKKKSEPGSNRASAKDRGRSASRWPYKDVVDRGYAVATIYYRDIDPDFDDQFQNGIHPLFYSDGFPNQGCSTNTVAILKKKGFCFLTNMLKHPLPNS